MRFGSISAVSFALMCAACSSGYTAGDAELNLASASSEAPEQGAYVATAAPAAGGRYDPATDVFVPAPGTYGSHEVLNSTAAPAASQTTANAPAAFASATVPAAPVQNVAFSSSASPAGEVPLLVQTCVQSVSGAFGNADGLAQRGYKLQRVSESRRKFQRKFPVSTFAALNGSHRSSGLELRANPRRSENYCSVTITSNESPGSVTAALRSSLANAGFREIGGDTWSNGSRQFKVSQFLSGSRVAWTTSVNITEAR